MFNCKFAQMDVTSSNIKIWENKLRTMTHLIPKIMLKRYGVNNHTNINKNKKAVRYKLYV